MKNVAIQKETNSSGPENRPKIVLLVDACQQTGMAIMCLIFIIQQIFFSYTIGNVIFKKEKLALMTRSAFYTRAVNSVSVKL